MAMKTQLSLDFELSETVYGQSLKTRHGKEEGLSKTL